MVASYGSMLAWTCTIKEYTACENGVKHCNVICLTLLGARGSGLISFPSIFVGVGDRHAQEAT